MNARPADRDLTRVIVTGAAGFIGRHLVVRQLEMGRQVIAVDLDIEPLRALESEANLVLLQGDFRDRSLLELHLETSDVCFHLASIHLESGVSQDRYWEVNVAGVRELVKRCHRARVGRFVHCSSVGVYGDLSNPPADESTRCNPDTMYEKSKLAGERAVEQYARQVGYPVVIIRPSWVYGPGCPRTHKLLKSVGQGWFFFVGNGKSLRHPIYIEDMIAALEIAATHPEAPGETFVIAGPRAVTVRELANEIAGALNAQPPRLRLPRGIVWAGCSLMEIGAEVFGLEAPFTRRSMKFFTGNSAFKTDKVERKLSFKPEIDLEQGLRRTIEVEGEPPKPLKQIRRLAQE